VGLRYNPPPGWPSASPGFQPQPGWQPDPSWPQPPPGWQLWVSDDISGEPATDPQLGRSAAPDQPGRQHWPAADAAMPGSGSEQQSWFTPRQPGDSAPQAAASPSAADGAPQVRATPDLAGSAQQPAALPQPPAASPGQSRPQLPAQDGQQPWTPLPPTQAAQQSWPPQPADASQQAEAAARPRDSLQQSWPAQQPAAEAGQGWATPPGATQPVAGAGQSSWGAAQPGAAQQGWGAGQQGWDGAQQSWGGAPPGGWTGQPGWGQQQYGATPSGYGMPAAQQPMSWQAIVAFITGLLGLPLFGVIFGILALVHIRSTGQRGRGLAIAGLVLSGLWIVGIIIFVALIALAIPTSTSVSGSSPVPRSAGSPAVQQHRTGSTSVFALLPGDCFNNPTDQQSIASVTSLPCTRAHDAQVFANFKLTGGNLHYPGTATVERRAAAGCNTRFPSSVSKSRITSSMSVRFIYPQQLAWTIGHRTVSCLIVDSRRDLRSSLVRS
jgi:hypothetical protein